MRRKRVIGTALGASCTLWLAGWIGTLAGLAGVPHVENVGLTAVAAVAAVCAFAAALERGERRARTSFVFFGAGMLAWALGQAAWTVYVLQGESVPWPALSDIGYLGAMPLFAAGVLTWPRRRRAWTGGALLDGTLAIGAVALVSHTFSFEPILESGVKGAQAWLGIATPVFMLALVGIVGVGLLFDRWENRWRLTMIGLGLLSLAVSSTVFAVDAVDAVDGSLTLMLDGAWTLAFASMGAASILPRSYSSRATGPIPEFVPPIVVTGLLGIAAGAFAAREVSTQGWHGIEALVVGLLLVLVATRVLLLARSQLRQNALLTEAQKALHEAQRTRDHFLVELVNAQERGSRQIADLLHDDVVQQLTALGFRLELEAQRTDLARLRELSHDTGKITASIRGLLVELHPAILDGRGLAPAIDVVAEGLRDHGIDVRVTPFPHRIQRETETLAYRLVQGALANVRSDPQARSAEVELGLHDGTLRGRVSSSGSGLEPDDHTSDGVGLLVARKRAELAGGRFLVNATRGHGTDIVFELPVPAPSDVAIEAVS